MVDSENIPRIIQIQMTQDLWNGSTIVALCEDGSLWRFVRKRHDYFSHDHWEPIALRKDG